MAYLKKADYTLRIGVAHLDEILEQAAETSGLTPTNILNNAESWAIATVKSFLSSQYDTDSEFNKDAESPEANRNFLIMQVTIDLVLCTLHKTINPRDLPEHIEKACTEAVEWLKAVRDKIITVELPEKELPTENEVRYDRSFIHSQPKFISKPFDDLSLFDREPVTDPNT